MAPATDTPRFIDDHAPAAVLPEASALRTSALPSALTSISERDSGLPAEGTPCLPLPLHDETIARRSKRTTRQMAASVTSKRARVRAIESWADITSPRIRSHWT